MSAPAAPPATLTFLGTADSKGVPRFWCACPVCQEARQGGVNRRTRTGLLLRGVGESGREEAVFLDASQDLHGQLAALGPLVPDAALLSHAHNDHILGLADLLDYLSYAKGALPLYAPEPVIPDLERRFHYAFRQQAPVQPVPPQGVPVAGFRVRTFEVPHGANGVSHAFRLDRPGWAGVVMTDALDVPDDVAQMWLTGLDLLVLGTSFTDESAQPRTGRSVYDVQEALAVPWARAARRVVLTHLSHGVDVRSLSLPAHWQAARDGLTIPL